MTRVTKCLPAELLAAIVVVEAAALSVRVMTKVGAKLPTPLGEDAQQTEDSDRTCWWGKTGERKRAVLPDSKI